MLGKIFSRLTSNGRCGLLSRHVFCYLWSDTRRDPCVLDWLVSPDTLSWVGIFRYFFSHLHKGANILGLQPSQDQRCWCSTKVPWRRTSFFFKHHNNKKFVTHCVLQPRACYEVIQKCIKQNVVYVCKMNGPRSEASSRETKTVCKKGEHERRRREV